MWHGLVSTLGDLVGAKAVNNESASCTNQRVNLRYPCDMEIICQPADQLQSVRLSAGVEDVSPAGIHLRTNHFFEIGAFLAIELSPSGSPPSSVLACVVRVEERSNGEWSLGCSFAAELGDQDLEAFGAPRIPGDPSDRRKWVRFPCTGDLTYQLVGSGDVRTAHLVDVSAKGISLKADIACEVGALLNLDLKGPEGRAVSKTLACVARVRPDGPGQWAMDCNFLTQLSDSELRAMV
jgi:hypothetical protein